MSVSSCPDLQMDYIGWQSKTGMWNALLHYIALLQNKRIREDFRLRHTNTILAKTIWESSMQSGRREEKCIFMLQLAQNLLKSAVSIIFIRRKFKKKVKKGEHPIKYDSGKRLCNVNNDFLFFLVFFFFLSLKQRLQEKVGAHFQAKQREYIFNGIHIYTVSGST